MFPTHLHPSADQWMRLYWGPAAPIGRAIGEAMTEAVSQVVEHAWRTTATTFLPPPWNMMASAAYAWRDLANAGSRSRRTSGWPTTPFDHRRPERLQLPAPGRASAARNGNGAATVATPFWPAPVGIAASPAAAPTVSATRSAFMPMTPSSAAHNSQATSSVVLINTFVVPIAMEESFLSWWRMLKPAFAAQPGFVSAKLHRSLDQNERYRFINIAEWESTEAYRAALTSMWSSVPKPTIAGLEWHPALYEVIEEA